MTPLQAVKSMKDYEDNDIDVPVFYKRKVEKDYTWLIVAGLLIFIIVAFTGLLSGEQYVN